MEEDKDLKILEKKLKEWEPYKNIKWATEIERQIGLENQAIENLIARYKELEKVLDDRLWNEHIHKETDKMWRNKVKEKIDELENQKSLYFEKQVIQGRIDLLQELLED